MNYHIDDWRAQQRAQSDSTQSPWEVRQRRRCIILLPWLRGRLHATNTLPYSTSFREYIQSCFPPFITADKRWNDAGQ